MVDLQSPGHCAQKCTKQSDYQKARQVLKKSGPQTFLETAKLSWMNIRDRHLSTSASQHTTWPPTLALVITALLGAYLLSRGTFVLTEPVFYAEECSVYLKHALRTGFWSALSFIYDRCQRFELIVNLPISFATLFPLRFAPYFTASTSFVVFLGTFYLILTRRLYVFTTRTEKVLAALTVLFCCYTLGCIFLNTLVVQPALGALAMVVLLTRSEYSQRITRIALDCALLTLAGLSGFYAVFLTPAFLFKAWSTRARHAWACFFVIAACTLMQATIMLTSTDQNYGKQFRGKLGLETPSAVVDQMILDVFVQPQWNIGLHDFVRDHWVVGWVVLGGLTTAIALYLLYSRHLGKRLLILALLSSAAGCIYGQAGHNFAGRYAALPRTAIGFLLIIQAAALLKDRGFTRRNSLPWTSFVLLLALISRGAIEHASSYPRELLNVPKWRSEVEQLQQYDYGDYCVTVFPAPRWLIHFEHPKRHPRLQVGREYTISDLGICHDHNSIQLPSLPGADRYLTISKLALIIEVEQAGEYQLEGRTWASDSLHDSWRLQTETGGRRKIEWQIPVTMNWSWTPAPEKWHLERGSHHVILHPLEPTPLSAIRVVPVEPVAQKQPS